MIIIYNVGCLGQTYILLPEQWPSAHKTNSERFSAQCQPSNEDKRKVRKKIWYAKLAQTEVRKYTVRYISAYVKNIVRLCLSKLFHARSALCITNFTTGKSKMDTSMIKHVSHILNLIGQSQAFQVCFTIEILKCSQVCKFAAGYLLLTAVSQFWADRSSGKKLPQRCST